MRDIVDVMLAVNCQAYSFEAGNVRHEHEWQVWQQVKLPGRQDPDPPGVVSHATNVDRAPRAGGRPHPAALPAWSGARRVVAGTDCGLGGRVHPQLAWAKLQSLAQGAALATQQLWR